MLEILEKSKGLKYQSILASYRNIKRKINKLAEDIKNIAYLYQVLGDPYKEGVEISSTLYFRTPKWFERNRFGLIEEYSSLSKDLYVVALMMKNHISIERKKMNAKLIRPRDGRSAIERILEIPEIKDLLLKELKGRKCASLLPFHILAHTFYDERIRKYVVNEIKVRFGAEEVYANCTIGSDEFSIGVELINPLDEVYQLDELLKFKLDWADNTPFFIIFPMDVKPIELKESAFLKEVNSYHKRVNTSIELIKTKSNEILRKIERSSNSLYFLNARNMVLNLLKELENIKEEMENNRKMEIKLVKELFKRGS